MKRRAKRPDATSNPGHRWQTLGLPNPVTAILLDAAGEEPGRATLEL